MRTYRSRFGGLALCLLGIGVALPLRSAESNYQFFKEISIRREAAWDLLAVDEVGRRAYVPHAGRVEVIDIDKDEVAGQILGTPGVRGFAVAPELGLGFSSNAGENKVSLVDLKTLQARAKAGTREVPAAIVYVPLSQEVYAFNTKGQSATVLEGETGKLIGTIPLPGKPVGATADPHASRVYCTINIEGADAGEVDAIDIKAHLVADHWPTPPGLQPNGLASDPQHHRLFVACVGNPKAGLASTNGFLLMMSSTNGKVISKVKTGAGADGVAFDPETQLLFVACAYEGTVVILHEDSPERFSLAQILKTARGARTIGLDSKTHKLYLPTADFEPSLSPGQPSRAIPGTFKVLVYGSGN